ncbi:hypothetical protein IEQ34_011077 [Dendrobium chrysotoxum]|uniref:Ubiquitin-like protease family profile domain-containing protein n=1 Tax=Dendrobium chrysotoxum TaxID=161865 RepID=A0AAV7GY65_DENCH|nr:hypothetical protein IEQ34_011077 [Dendrobium chrysotoxum]
MIISIRSRFSAYFRRKQNEFEDVFLLQEKVKGFWGSLLASGGSKRSQGSLPHRCRSMGLASFKGKSLTELWFLEHTTIHAPVASKARPRFLRWGCDITYNKVEASSLFESLEDVNILNSFEGITSEERAYLDQTSTSPQTFPNLQLSLIKPRRYIVSSPSKSITPPSPVRPPSPQSDTQAPVSPPRPQQPTSPNEPTSPKHDSLQEGINKIIAQNKIILKRLVQLEATSGLLEHRVDVIEHQLFDQREKDSRFEAIEKFVSQQFPTFKPLNTGYQAESSSRTVTEEKPIEKQDELNDAPLPDPLPEPLPDQSKVEVHQEADVNDSTCSTGIARRVRRRIDRKPKEVQSPFTTGQYKKRTLTKKAVARPARTATTFINVETVKSPEPRPAPAQVAYPGRPMIDENIRMFIVDCLKKYTDNEPLGTARYFWVPLGTSGYLWVPLGTSGYRWVLMVIARFLLADNLSTARYCLVPLGTAFFCLLITLGIGRYWSVLIGTDRYRLVFLLVDELLGDIIYSVGNVHIFRSQIDELLTDQYLDNNHIDAFAILLAEKSKLCPTLYQPFIHVSSLHWYVSHVSKDSVRAANLLLMPVSKNEHWTLLVADLKSLSWTFFDSLPNPTHKAVLPDVINHLHEETGDYFESDFRSWPLTVASGVPTQKNGFDCEMFVCKYMENAILAHPLKWEELSHWQDEMPKFRAELAFALLCKTIN